MSQNTGTALFVVAIFLTATVLMALGWRRRARAQDSLFQTLPAVPAHPGEIILGPLSGVYIGTAFAQHWQERVVRAPLGLRSAGTLTAYSTGLQLDLANDTVWIPRSDLVSVRRASKLANKVVPGQGLLVARWQLHGSDGVTEVDTGFRADDKDAYPHWAEFVGNATEMTTGPQAISKEKK